MCLCMEDLGCVCEWKIEDVSVKMCMEDASVYERLEMCLCMEDKLVMCPWRCVLKMCLVYGDLEMWPLR